MKVGCVMLIVCDGGDDIALCVLYSSGVGMVVNNLEHLEASKTSEHDTSVQYYICIGNNNYT